MEAVAVIEWMLSPADPSRSHEIATLASWHGRLMVISWAVLLPWGVLVARFFKVTARQDWPRELDHRGWWHGHLWLQWTGAAFTLAGLGLIVAHVGSVALFDSPHHTLGWLTVALMGAQIGAGMFRGTKGGPTYPAPDGSWRGDHFDMTRRRKVFEYTHKFGGYVVLVCGSLAILFGLRAAHAPVWMWALLVLWWGVLIAGAAYLQRRGRAVDTYQAIWGADPELPGNKIKPIGFGIKRHTCETEAGAPHS